jgi:hypothetical protein
MITINTIINDSVKWFRAEDRNENQKLVRRVAAVALAVFLCLTVIGIIIVNKGIHEWKRQESLPSKIVTSLEIFSITQETSDLKMEMENEVVEIKPPSKIVTSLEIYSITQETTDVKMEVEKEVVQIKPPPKIETFLETNTITQEVIKVKKEDGFPKPFETLKNLKKYSSEEEKEIITKVDRALRRNIPRNYDTLQRILSNEELQQLFSEAKILAHYWAVKDDPNDTPPADIYRTLIVTNLDMLLRGLAMDKSFPRLGK